MCHIRVILITVISLLKIRHSGAVLDPNSYKVVDVLCSFDRPATTVQYFDSRWGAPAPVQIDPATGDLLVVRASCLFKIDDDDDADCLPASFEFIQ